MEIINNVKSKGDVIENTAAGDVFSYEGDFYMVIEFTNKLVKVFNLTEQGVQEFDLDIGIMVEIHNATLTIN